MQSQLVFVHGQAIRGYLSKVCEAHSVELVAPPPKYCTDNGVMIAWNGVEKMRRGNMAHPV